jgi:hypothetical protein
MFRNFLPQLIQSNNILMIIFKTIDHLCITYEEGNYFHLFMATITILPILFVIIIIAIIFFKREFQVNQIIKL